MATVRWLIIRARPISLDVRLTGASINAGRCSMALASFGSRGRANGSASGLGLKKNDARSQVVSSRQ